MTRDTGKKRAASTAADSDVLQSMVSNYIYTHTYTLILSNRNLETTTKTCKRMKMEKKAIAREGERKWMDE